MRKMYRHPAVFLVMLFTSVSIQAQNLAAIPPLSAPVMDTAHMMSPNARETLNTHLWQYSQRAGSQIVVLTVPRIAPETPFDYSTRVMQQWKIGRSQYNDGVLLLIVRDERKTHMAVGRGLEGAIPDVYAKRLLQDVLRPHLQQGNIDRGIYETVAQTEKLIAGEKLPENPTNAPPQNSDTDWLGIIIMMIVATGALGGILRAILGRTLGAAATGGALGLLAWLLTGSFIAAVILGVISLIITLIGGLGSFVSAPRGGGNWRNSGGFHGHGGGLGGGFRGGGGGFGGGGASGDW